MVADERTKLDSVQEQLKDGGEDRVHAIEVLSMVDEHPEALVEELAPALTEAVLAERNAYTAMRGWAELERMAEAHPRGLVPVLSTIIDELSERADPLDDEDFSKDRALSSGAAIIEQVADGVDARIDLDVDRLHELLNDQAADAEFRRSMYLLLGLIATVEAIEELTAAHTWEVPVARESIEVALENACSIVIDSITGDGGLPRSEGVRAIRHLHDSGGGIIPVIEDQLREGLPDLIAGIERDTASGTADLLVVLAHESDDVAREIGEELVEQQLDDPSEARARVIATYIDEHRGSIRSISDLLPDPSESGTVDEWPEEMGLMERSLVAGLEHETTAAIAHAEIDHLLRKGQAPELPLVLLEYIREGSYGRLTRFYDRLAVGMAPDGAVIESRLPYLFEGLRSPDEEIRKHARYVAEALVGWHPEVSSPIIEGSMERLLSADDTDDHIWWGILEEGARKSPAEFLTQLTRYYTLLDEPSDIRTNRVLRLVEEAASRMELPPQLASTILSLLESDRTRTVQATIDAVSKMGFYPPPEALLELRRSPNNQVRSAADRTVRELRRNHTPIAVGQDTDQVEGVVLFGGTGEAGGDLYLKEREDDGLWRDVALDQFRRSIIEAVIERIDRDANVPLVYPYYLPEDVVVLTIAAALSNIESDSTILLFSPGSQTQWGTKGEIREELEQFAISTEKGRVIGATPVPDVVPHAYVSQGEVKTKSDGKGPGRIILTKDLAEIAEIDDIDLGIANLVCRTEEELAGELADIEASHPDAQFVNAYSYYVRNEGDGRPRYGPPEGLSDVPTVPGPDIIDDTIERVAVEADRSSVTEETEAGRPHIEGNGWQRGADDVIGLTQPARIRIEKVDAPELEALFDQLFELSAGLRGVDDQGAGSLIFSRHLFFERLPVSTSKFDEWVRERYYAGDRFVPPLIEERIGDVREKSRTVENLEAVQPLDRAEKLLERVAERLQETNPLAERLEEHIQIARSTGSRTAILSESPKHAQILRAALVDRGAIGEGEIQEETVTIVSPDSARSLGHHDRLIVPGALHPENSGFYLLPQVDETIVLTYDRTWAGMVERHATEFVERLNAVVGGAGYEPYADPNITGDIGPEMPESSTPIEESGAVAAADSDGTTEWDEEASVEPGAAGRRSKLDILTEAMESVSSSEYREESGRYDHETRHFDIETKDGTIIQTDNHDRFMRRRQGSDGGGAYHWVGPDMLSTGDEFVTLPDEIEAEMWRTHLDDIYSDEMDANMAASGLKAWYESIQEIWFAAENRLEEGGAVAPTGRDVAKSIHQELTRTNPGFDRAEATVRSWFESVIEADRPLELAERPELVIGPRDHRDIETIGRAFDIDRLQDGAMEIEGAMRGLRTINRQEGLQYRESILEEMNSDSSNKVREAAVHRTVEAVREVTVEETAGES